MTGPIDPQTSVPRRATRPSVVMRAIASYGGAIVQLVVGGVLLTVGLVLLINELEKEPHEKMVMYISLGIALFGALLIPGIFPVAQRISVLVFPNGIPFIGGRRTSDPPIGSAAAQQIQAAGPVAPATNVVVVSPESAAPVTPPTPKIPDGEGG